MRFWSTYLLAFFLGIVINSDFDSVLAENHTKVEKPDQEQQTVETTTREDQTKSTNHDVSSKIPGNQTESSGSVNQHPPSTESGFNTALNSEKEEISADELDDTSMHSPEVNVSKPESMHSPGVNVSKPENFVDLRPKFRRYYDYVHGRPIVERFADGKWERIVPTPKPGDQFPMYNTNVSRFILLENGTRIERRSKLDFSYDNIHWYRPSRIRVNIPHPEKGTIVKYKFGPKKWLSPFRDRVFASANDNKTYEDMGPGRTVYQFGTEESYFRAPSNYSGDYRKFKAAFKNSPNGTHRQEVYRYGPVTERSQNALGQDSNWRSRYKFGSRMNQHYGYDYPRDQYPPRGWNDNRPYNDRYPYNYPYLPNYGRYPEREYDQRQQYGGTYDERNYAPYPNDYRRPNHYQDRGYDQRYDDYDRRRYDDGRHDQQYGDPQTGGRYDQGHKESYNDQRYGEPQYDGRRYDQGYGQGYDDRKRDYQPNNAYEERKADRPTYRESAGSYNGSSYQQPQQFYGRGSYQNAGPRQRSYPGGGRDYRDRDYRDRPHGESYEDFKWKFPYLDRNKIPEDSRKQQKYFLQEYYDILVKTSKHLWIMHRDMRTLLQDYETLKQDGLNPKVMPSVINGSMSMLSELASSINTQMDGNLTLAEVRYQPIDRTIYSRLMNNFDRIMETLRDYRKPTGTPPIVDDLLDRLSNHKKYLYTTYGDIAHMIAVLRRTVKKYGYLDEE